LRHPHPDATLFEVSLCLPTAPALPLWGTETSERRRFLGSSRASSCRPVHGHVGCWGSSTMAGPELIKCGALCQGPARQKGGRCVAFPRVAKADQDNIASSGPECGDEAGWVVPPSREALENHEHCALAPGRNEGARRLISQPPLFFTFRHPRCLGTGKPRLARELPKNGDVPKSPFPTAAALVPSAGTINRESGHVRREPASTRCRTRAVIRELQTRRSQSTKEPEWKRACPASISCATTLRSAFDWRRKLPPRHINRFSSTWPTGGSRSPSTPRKLKKDSPGQGIAESA
jgi:hypothetical protein